MEAAMLCACVSAQVLAASKRGLKRGLRGRKRTIKLMLDETIISEIPPLRCCWGRKGEQVEIPIIGEHDRRVIHGALNIETGAAELFITEEWNAETHQVFLKQIRRVWRGWNIILFQDKGSPHTACESKALATKLGIEIRWLPTATSELNACEALWCNMKGSGVANRAVKTIDESAQAACDFILDKSPLERLQMAGVLSGNFWLTT
jgi:transposase